MSKEIRDTPAAQLPSTASHSTRQLIEAMVELLRQENAPADNVRRLFGELTESIERCFASRHADGSREDALERAPWLTADAERLKQQQSQVCQSLQHICLLAGRQGGLPESLSSQFDDFVELFLEHEAAEHVFLQAAYPGPTWAAQS